MAAALDNPALCRDCLAEDTMPPGRRCRVCGSPRIVRHPELRRLTIAHIDCDAFYAAVEKRDDPGLADRPVVIGGGRRGVVAAACYIARLYGVRSAMPMFKALDACPDAVVIRPNMAKYRAVGLQIRELMRSVTPLVEPLSIDEAFLDLTGTEALHHGSAARSLARLVLRIETEIGVSASIGLSYNKFLAKVASDLDKPRGFAIIGRDDAGSFLADKPVNLIWGVGRALQSKLQRDGITKIAQLQTMDEMTLVARYGSIGTRLYHFARGADDRAVNPNSEPKSISAETTFETDIAALELLSKKLWPLCESVARSLRHKTVAGRTVILKLKRADFRILTRSRRLATPTQLAETIYGTALQMLEKEAVGPAFRLIGVGVADLGPSDDADPPGLFDPSRAHGAKVERTIDAIRAKLGDAAIRKGRGL